MRAIRSPFSRKVPVRFSHRSFSCHLQTPTSGSLRLPCPCRPVTDPARRESSIQHTVEVWPSDQTDVLSLGSVGTRTRRKTLPPCLSSRLQMYQVCPAVRL